MFQRFATQQSNKISWTGFHGRFCSCKRSVDRKLWKTKAFSGNLGELPRLESNVTAFCHGETLFSKVTTAQSICHWQHSQRESKKIKNREWAELRYVFSVSTMAMAQKAGMDRSVVIRRYGSVAFWYGSGDGSLVGFGSWSIPLLFEPQPYRNNVL